MKQKKELDKDLKKETARRIKKMQQEFRKPWKFTVFQNKHNYDQIIAQVNIPITALCEHHHVAFHGIANIAYIPGDWVVGLSKLARVAERYLNPTVYTVQEKATHLIMRDLKKALNPKGVMVVIKATHDCIAYRGVKKPSITITSAVDGVFAEDTNGARQEFLSLVNSNHNS